MDSDRYPPSNHYHYNRFNMSETDAILIIYMNHTGKTLIFSDTHFTKKVDKRRLEYMRNLISHADEIIINGDLWDGYLITFDQFLNSGWKELFPLLKAKATIYITGNHDNLSLIDERYKRFASTIASNYAITTPNKQFIIQHGHIELNEKGNLIDKIYAYGEDHFSKGINKAFIIYSEIKDTILHLLFGKYARIYSLKLINENRNLIKHFDNIAKPNSIYICGHTHLAEISESGIYYNSGYIRYGNANYIMIEGNEIQVVTESY